MYWLRPGTRCPSAITVLAEATGVAVAVLAALLPQAASSNPNTMKIINKIGFFFICITYLFPSTTAACMIFI